jgi:hypothetical protein
MNRSITLPIELALLAAIALLAVLLLIPRPAARQPVAAGPLQGEAVEQPDAEPQAPVDTRSVAEVAGLLGWSAPRAAASDSRPRAVEPEPLGWLKPTGYVVGEDGVRYYVFKDSRRNAVISVALGVENKGWKLLEVTEKGFVLEHEGKAYLVRRE